MATPQTLILKKENKYILFQVRHDGGEIEVFLKNKKMAFENTFDETIPKFLNFFYPKGFPDYALQTVFNEGFKSNLENQTDPLSLIKINKWSANKVINNLIHKLENNLRSDLKSKNIENDGLLSCGDGGILLDFDTKLLFGLTSPIGNERIYDQNLKIFKFKKMIRP